MTGTSDSYGAVDTAFITALQTALGSDHVRVDEETRVAYGTDALKKGQPADVVVWPGSTADVAAVMRLCTKQRVPVVPRGAGTGYTGGAVPTHGGVVLSLERLNRILEIDEANLLAVVEAHVITGDLQRAVEAVGLFYPPDPASLSTSTIGGNIAECAGGPRAFKYGVTKRYVLGLEAVLPSGEVVHTGSKSVKNVVGYDLTQLLVGSEGTLAVITKATLRLVPLPPTAVTLRATFATIRDAVDAVTGLIRARVTPSALELIDGDSLDAVATNLGTHALAPEGTGAVLLLDVDGLEAAVGEEAARVGAACEAAGATEVLVARDRETREELWRVRRALSLSLRVLAPLKINHDVVVPKGRIPELFDLIARLRAETPGVRLPCFGHVGDGNIHVNMMLDPADGAAVAAARRAERALFEGVVALEGSISGEHGIGFSKKPFVPLELSSVEIALMRRVKAAFDPMNILNPGKMFPDHT
ncbi:MAG TPA: FAD-linked oxidase C-terminal domain-containing protein [Luteitalea sp.]|nr:FAD-linked oxidase C-terminal domain-containing protein [Luteitalea sp.]